MLGGEARAARAAQHAGELDRSLDVLDGAAAPARHVVVRVRARVEHHRPATRLDAADEAQVLEQLERRVDGRQRGARQGVRHACENLLRREVPLVLAQEPMDEQPLRRHALAAVAQELAEGLVGHVPH